MFALLDRVSISRAESLSVPLKLTIESCANNTIKAQRLTCALMMHDMLCFSSVMNSAIDLADDRKKCLSETDNPVFQDYLRAAMEESKDREDQQQLLQAAYQQWQHNIATLLPMPLEPEYQFKVRRDTNSQNLVMKIFSIK